MTKCTTTARPRGYWQRPEVQAELADLISNPKLSIKSITTKYDITKSRLYQILEEQGLNTKYKYKPSRLDKYEYDKRFGRVCHMLKSRKQHKQDKGYTGKQDAELSDLLVNDKLPEFCPILGVELRYTSPYRHRGNEACVSLKDFGKGYSKDNVAILSWKAHRILRQVTPEELANLTYYARYHVGLT